MISCGSLLVLLAGAPAAPPDAPTVLADVRKMYRTLAGYDFERVLTIEENKPGDQPTKVGEVMLVTATAQAGPPPASSAVPVNPALVRFGAKGDRSELQVACDGQTSVLYTSLGSEYMKGKTIRDVCSRTKSSFLLGLHLHPFDLLTDTGLRDARLGPAEEIDVGQDRRRCHVVEGVIPADGPALRTDWLPNMLISEGLIAARDYPRYTSAPAGGRREPARVTLWVDPETHAVVRARVAARLFKSTRGPAGKTDEPTEVTVTDRFTVAKLTAPPADRFTFTPPAGAQEGPNLTTGRDKK